MTTPPVPVGMSFAAITALGARYFAKAVRNYLAATIVPALLRALSPSNYGARGLWRIAGPMKLRGSSGYMLANIVLMATVWLRVTRSDRERRQILSWIDARLVLFSVSTETERTL